MVLSLLLLVLSKTTYDYKDVVITAFKYIDSVNLSSDEILQKMGAQDSYINSNDIIATKGKNIVVIYCESLENGFLNEKAFAKETPNLRRLSNEGWQVYSDYETKFGSDWTVGALYATQTGFPTLFARSGHRIFTLKNEADSKIVSYTKVLSKAGYNNVFLSACELDFDGTGNLMETLGYETKEIDDIEVPKNSTWGWHDLDLFNEAKTEYRSLQAKGEPFNLTLLTVDTHAANGFSDDRMDKYIATDIPRGGLEFALASLDYLINDFLQFIATQPGYENTVVIILGDHPFMGAKAESRIVDKLGDNRKVTLMTSESIPNYRQDMHLAFYDIPNMILDLAQIKHNVRFSGDLFPNMSEGVIKENQALFTILNLKLVFP